MASNLYDFFFIHYFYNGFLLQGGGLTTYALHALGGGENVG